MRRTAKKPMSERSDEYYTLREDITPLLDLIPKDKVIWLPFDTEESEYYKVFKEAGYKIIHTHTHTGHDYLEYEPEHYDIAVSNIPFSLKIQILAKAVERDKPFIFLVPSNSFSLKIVKTNAENMNFIWKDKRHKFIHNGELKSPAECVYVCYKAINKNLIY